MWFIRGWQRRYRFVFIRELFVHLKILKFKRFSLNLPRRLSLLNSNQGNGSVHFFFNQNIWKRSRLYVCLQNITQFKISFDNENLKLELIGEIVFLSFSMMSHDWTLFWSLFSKTTYIETTATLMKIFYMGNRELFAQNRPPQMSFINFTYTHGKWMSRSWKSEKEGE